MINDHKQEEFPRPDSMLYNLLFANEETKDRLLRRFKKLNKYLIIPLYRIKFLPLLGFGKIFLLLITKGRISGKKKRTPLEYHRIEGTITVVSARGEEADWLKNMRANPNEVWVKYGFHSFQARVEFVTDEQEILKLIKWYVVKHKRIAKLIFGWNPKLDDPETADFSKLIQLIILVQFHPRTE
ncbi:MAG: nitroreductase family deazaflavin-dependent oxidoreductase [Promethearchaeota archaeon]|nr:MAG: nitroreductase family deazaflavin-dependent oxidoreductase [Candidatus Lokiarchaeota archaeon]